MNKHSGIIRCSECNHLLFIKINDLKVFLKQKTDMSYHICFIRLLTKYIKIFCSIV